MGNGLGAVHCALHIYTNTNTNKIHVGFEPGMLLKCVGHCGFLCERSPLFLVSCEDENEDEDDGRYPACCCLLLLLLLLLLLYLVDLVLL